MFTVWKCEFPVNDKAIVEMPVGARVVKVGSQRRGFICLWALVNTDANKTERTFVVRGTGHPCPGDMPYIGSVFDGPFVWHVFGDN